MFKRILLPMDGSHLAETALPAASLLAQKLCASVTLLHLIEKNAPGEIHGQSHLKTPEEATRYLQGLANSYFPPEMNLDVHVHTTEVTNVAQSIAVHADELNQDLVIMCSHGKGGFRSWLSGSIGQQVIANGKTPVLLIQTDADGRTSAFDCSRILVPVDGNPDHACCVHVASQLAINCSAQLDMISVVPTPATLKAENAATGKLLPATMAAMLLLAEENAVKYLTSQSKELQGQGITIRTQVLRGDPAASIVEAARKANSGLIVLSTHGKTGQEAFWAGSVTPRVAAQTKIPILLVPV